jgi:hypothetical protein
VDLLLGDRAVLDSLGHDEQLTRPEGDIAITQLDDQAALEHEKEVIGVVVLVPHELALRLDDHEDVAVELVYRPRLPVLREGRQLLCQIHHVHVGPLPGPRRMP